MDCATFHESENWHDSYRAALFETDRHELPNRIAQAERAIITRGRELFQSPQVSKNAKPWRPRFRDYALSDAASDTTLGTHDRLAPSHNLFLIPAEVELHVYYPPIH
jgi:hypothetical protein